MVFSARRLIVNLLEGTILVILIAAAGYVSVGRILVANVGKFRQNIEKQLSAALNVDVHIGRISGSWTYLDPNLSIDDLVIGHPGKAAIQIGHVSARIGTLASIFERNAVVRKLDVGRLQMTVTQNGDGSWQIEGMPRGTGSGKPFNPDPLLASLRYLHGVDISNVNVEVNARHRHYHISNQPNRSLELVEEGVQKTFYMPLSIKQAGNGKASQFELLGRYSGDPRDIERFTANLYLRLPQIELADFLPGTVDNLKLNRVALRGQLWMDCNHGEFELRGLPVIDEISVIHKGEPVSLVRDFSASIAAGTWGPGQWQLHMEKIKARFGRVSWQGKTMDVALQFAPAGLSWAARLPDLDIAKVDRMVRGMGASGPLTVQNLAALKAIDPGGNLKDILVKGGTGGLKLTAAIDDAHIKAWRSSPGISAINGFAALSPSHGYIDVYNTKPFTTDFSLFPEPWSLDSASARLHYNYSSGYVRVTSGLVRLAIGNMTASARVHVNLPTDPAMRSWGLEIGIIDTKLKDVHKFVPVTVSENLTTWLHRAQEGGEAKESGLLFHGTLGPDHPKASRTYELFFKARNATLDFDPHWPPVDNLAATVYIGDWGLASDDARGKIFETTVSGGHVSMPATDDKPADSIFIEAKAAGPLTDGIKLLTETPVAAATNNMAKGWLGSGDMTSTVKLDIPVGDRTGEPAGVDVGINLTGDNIMMPAYDLDVLNIDGVFRYQDDKGLSAPKFTAELFNHAVSGSIHTHNAKAGGAVEVALDGKVDMGDLYKWSGQTILSRASGASSYSVLLHIPIGSAAAHELGYVEARSNLKGVAIDLPPPMGKSATEEKRLVYRQTFLKPGNRIDLALGARTKASLRTVNGIVEGGQLHFGESPLGKVAYDKVRITGNLDFVDYRQWEQVTRYLENKSSVSLQSAATNTLDYIDVSVARLKAFGMSLDSVRTHIARSKSAWNIHLKNGTLLGSISVPDDSKLPLDVSLDYFRYNAVEGKDGGKGVDPLAGVQPSGFLPIDFKIKQLMLNGEDYGRWSFKFRPDKTGGTLDELTSEVKGLSIQNDSKVAWDASDDGGRTTFKGTIKVPDLAKALKAWGLASSIEGQDFVFDADVAWAGSPAMVNPDAIQGMVKLDQGKGRFVQAEAGGGALKLLGIFDFASLAKRFRFDFSDIVKKGFSFSEIKGSARLDNGDVSVVDPVVITGPSSTIKLGGSVNLKSGKLDSDMIVTLPVARNLPWYAAYSAIATGPLAGAGVWLAQKIFGNQINQMSSAKYKISGTIDQPSIEFVSIFNDKVRESSAEPEPLQSTRSTEKQTESGSIASKQASTAPQPGPNISQPTAPQPAAPQPATPQPATPQPATPQPAAPQPATPQPAAPQPAAPQPATPQPATPSHKGEGG